MKGDVKIDLYSCKFVLGEFNYDVKIMCLWINYVVLFVYFVGYRFGRNSVVLFDNSVGFVLVWWEIVGNFVSF